MKKQENDLIFLHKTFQKMYKDLNKSNWQNNISFFLQEIIRVNYNDKKDRAVSGWLASLCEKAYYYGAYKMNKETRFKFKNNLLNIFNLKSIPNFLKEEGEILCGKKQPAFINTLLPTLDRYEVIEKISSVFERGLEGLIIGGSMSYGSFYSVRHNNINNDYSDIDGLVIFDNKFLNNKSFNNEIFVKKDIDNFLNRLKDFKKIYRNKRADTISHRFSLKDKKYTVSLHFIPISVFEDMVNKKLSEGLRYTDYEFTIKDYRIDNFNHPCFARHTFDGSRYESIIKSEKIEYGGYISHVPGFTIFNDKFFPGIFQTVILPHFLVYEDKRGMIKSSVKKFENIIYKEVDKMRKKFPIAYYSFAHNRYDIFAPGRYDNGLNSFVSPIKNFNSKNKKGNKKLNSWVKNTLNKADHDIKIFIKEKNSEKILNKFKKNGKDWFSVCFVSAKKENTKIQILPKQLMQLEGYEKLSMKYGKVFVASIYDPANYNNRDVIYYSIIIKTR